jgi:putative peptidoglycan lipid II flippase
VTLYRVGAFKSSDVPVVAGALRWWAAGLIFYALTMFLLRAFYSLKDTRTPMWVNLVLTVCVQIALYMLLSTGIGSWKGIGINGIPIADATFYFCVAMTLALLLRKRIGGYDIRGVASTLLRMALASAIGAAAAWGVAAALAPIGGAPSGAIVQVMCGGIVGLVVAFGFGRLLGVDEVAQGGAMVARAFGRLTSGKR